MLIPPANEAAQVLRASPHSHGVHTGTYLVSNSGVISSSQKPTLRLLEAPYASGGSPGEESERETGNYCSVTSASPDGMHSREQSQKMELLTLACGVWPQGRLLLSRVLKDGKERVRRWDSELHAEEVGSKQSEIEPFRGPGWVQAGAGVRGPASPPGRSSLEFGCFLCVMGNLEVRRSNMIKCILKTFLA